MKLAFVSVLAAATALAQTGRIEGVVSDSASRQPVKKAMVSLRPMIMNAGQNQAPQAVITDSTGAFAFENLAAGQYQLTIRHPNYPQSNMGGIHKTVQVSSNETASSVAVELTPGASVSGHVFDEDGDPLNGCFVTLHPARNPNQGILMRGLPAQGEDGSYKLSAIMPGQYTISAQCTPRVFQPRPLSEGPDPPPSHAYPVQFYPNAGDLKSAQVVELLPGAEKSGIDFEMHPVPVTKIHGHVIAGSADWHGRTDLHVTLLPLDPHAPRMSGPGLAQVHSNDGSFDLPQVFPGSYRLAVFSQNFSRGGEIDTQNRVGAMARVDVSDKPVELTVPLQGAIDIPGTLHIEQANNSPNAFPPGAGTSANGLLALSSPPAAVAPSQIQIQMTSEMQFGVPPPFVQPNDDGSFTVKSLLPGEWRIRVMGPSVFLKSARFGNDDVTNKIFDLTSGAAGPLELVVSNNTGSITGATQPGAMVFAARIDPEDLQQGWNARPADANGQFIVPNLAPGKYRVVVGEAGSPMPEEGGREVTVNEGEIQTVDLTPEKKP